MNEKANGGLCIGTYPKWQAKVIRWFLKRSPTTTVEFIFRGRGTTVERRTWGADQSYMPVAGAKKVAIYVGLKPSITKRLKMKHDKVVARWNEKVRIEAEHREMMERRAS